MKEDGHLEVLQMGKEARLSLEHGHMCLCSSWRPFEGVAMDQKPMAVFGITQQVLNRKGSLTTLKLHIICSKIVSFMDWNQQQQPIHVSVSSPLTDSSIWELFSFEGVPFSVSSSIVSAKVLQKSREQRLAPACGCIPPRHSWES